MDILKSVNVNKPDTVKRSNVMCCRACLATDCKLYNMHEYNFVQEFVRVSGFSVKEMDQLPHHLCVWCMSLLQRFAAFRAKCLRANMCLLSQLIKGDLTTDSVCTIDRIANKLVYLSQNETEVIDCVNVPVEVTDCPIFVQQHIPILNQSDKINDTDAEAKDILTNDLLIKVERDVKLETEIDIGDDFDVVEYMKNKKTEDFDVVELDNSEDDSFETTSNTKLYVSAISREELKSVVTKINKVSVSKKSKGNKSDASVVARKVRNSTQLENPLITKRRNKKKEISKFTTEENNYMPRVDFEKFEQTYNVKVTALTLAEQLAHIGLQRASIEYQTAPYRCQPCGKYFRDDEIYNRHTARHAKEAGSYECQTCTLRFKLSSKCREHQDRHRFKIVCSECGFVSRIRSQAKQHHNFHAGKTYTCEHCGKVCSKTTSYYGHLRLAHPTKNVACNMCGEIFINEDGIQLHKSLMHRAPKDDKLRACETCSITFISLDAMEKHKDTAGDHADLTPCIQCGENFGSEEKMKEHVKVDHPHCEECKSTFLSTCSFEVHVRRKHLGRGRADSERRAAAARRARARGQAPPPQHESARRRERRARAACCERCGKIIANEAQLRVHRCNLEDAERFACNECSKTFVYKGNLITHLRTHTGEKPHQCPQCSRAFTSRNNMKRHHTTVHLNIRGRYPCPICARALTTASTLRVHIKEVHGGERPKRIRKRKVVKLVESPGDSLVG